MDEPTDPLGRSSLFYFSHVIETLAWLQAGVELPFVLHNFRWVSLDKKYIVQTTHFHFFEPKKKALHFWPTV